MGWSARLALLAFSISDADCGGASPSGGYTMYDVCSSRNTAEKNDVLAGQIKQSSQIPWLPRGRTA